MSNQDVFVVHVPIAGALSVSSGVLRYVLPFDAECVDIQGQVTTAPTGANATFAVKVNGTSKATVTVVAGGSVATEIKTLPGATPGTNVITTPYPDPVAVFKASKGDYVTVDVTQVGSTVAGSNAVLALTFIRK
jgi:hypothetical protein